MSIRQILALKRQSIQTRIDALGAQEASLRQTLVQLAKQTDGLSGDDLEGAFQIAAMANKSVRFQTARLEKDCEALQSQRQILAREKLALDVADHKLETEERKAARLAASRAADRNV